MRMAIVMVAAMSIFVSAASGTSTVEKNGIRGTVIKSPTSPVCVEGSPCSAPAVGIVLIALRKGVRVARTTTSEAGTYRFVLRPGTYVVRSSRTSMFGTIAPRTVRVVAGRFAVANFEIDTGVR